MTMSERLSLGLGSIDIELALGGRDVLTFFRDSNLYSRSSVVFISLSIEIRLRMRIFARRPTKSRKVNYSKSKFVID